MDLIGVIQDVNYESMKQEDFIVLKEKTYGVLRHTSRYKTFISFYVLDETGELEVIRIKPVKRSSDKSDKDNYVTVATKEETEKFLVASRLAVSNNEYDVSFLEELEMLEKKGENGDES